MIIKRTIEIEAEEKDLKILDKYGFYYKKNFEEMIKEVANEIRDCESRRKNERRRKKKEA